MKFLQADAGAARRTIDRVIPFAALGAVVLAVGHAGLTHSGSNAGAQPQAEPLTSTPFNAAEQRRQMIEQLRELNQRIARVETKLNQPLEVRVKEMPPIVLPPQQTP